MGIQNLSVSVSPFRTDICPTGVLQNNETCSGSTSTHGYLSIHLSRRPFSVASIKGGADTVNSFDLPAVRGSESGDQSKQIQTDSTSEYGVPGGHSKSTAHFPAKKLRKVQQLAQHLLHQPRISVRDLARFLGKTSASTWAIWPASLHFRALQFLINSVSPGNHPMETADVAKKFITNLALTIKAREDLNWWYALDGKVQMQSPLRPRMPTMTIESDVLYRCISIDKATAKFL